jgi:tRNA modification GTPase
MAATQKCRLRAEAEVALAAATTVRAASILLDQYHGALSREVAAVDQMISRGELPGARQRLAALLSRDGIGLHLMEPWRVAIAGRPNVGKSSLINALVGYERAIVFDQPGTTRDVLTAETAIDGWPVRLADVAGIRHAVDPLEAEGVARAQRQVQEADLVLWLVDAAALGAATGAAAHATAHREMAEAFGDLRPDISAVLVAANKSDLLPQPLEPDAAGVIGISALRGAGLDHLLAAVSQRLAPCPTTAGQAVPFTDRQTRLLEAALACVDRGEAAAASAALQQLSGPPAC